MNGKVILICAFMLLGMGVPLRASGSNYYCIQLLSTRSRRVVGEIAGKFKKNLLVKRYGRVYGVFLGRFEDRRSAEVEFKKMKPEIKRCCRDAFVRVCPKFPWLEERSAEGTKTGRKGGTRFCIQLIAASDFQKAEKVKGLFPESDVRIRRSGNYYVVLMGNFSSFQDAEKELENIESDLQKCCPDSFIRTCNF